MGRTEQSDLGFGDVFSEDLVCKCLSLSRNIFLFFLSYLSFWNQQINSGECHCPFPCNSLCFFFFFGVFSCSLFYDQLTLVNSYKSDSTFHYVLQTVLPLCLFYRFQDNMSKNKAGIPMHSLFAKFSLVVLDLERTLTRETLFLNESV